jgi:hypothetical protein
MNKKIMIIPLIVLLSISSVFAGKSFIVDTYIDDGDLSTGDGIFPSVFYMDGKIVMITVRRYCAGEGLQCHHGWEFNEGTGDWTQNNTIANEFRRCPAVSCYASEGRFSVLEFDGNINIGSRPSGNDYSIDFWTWNGTAWDRNTTLESGIGWYDAISSPELFRLDDGNVYMWIGRNALPTYLKWTGSTWTSESYDSTYMNASGYGVPSYLGKLDGKHYVSFSGEGSNDQFNPHYWNGTNWIYEPKDPKFSNLVTNQERPDFDNITVNGTKYLLGSWENSGDTGGYKYSIPAYCDVELTSCQGLSSANTYYCLGNDVNNSGGGDCFEVTATNVTLDCLDNKIEKVTTGDVGIDRYGNYDNGTVLNCELDGWWAGIRFRQASHGTVHDSHFTGNTHGVILQSSGGDNAEYFEMYDNTGSGRCLTLESGVHHANYHDNNCGGVYNRGSWSNFTDSTIGGVDELTGGENNWINCSIGTFRLYTDTPIRILDSNINSWLRIENDRVIVRNTPVNGYYQIDETIDNGGYLENTNMTGYLRTINLTTGGSTNKLFPYKENDIWLNTSFELKQSYTRLLQNINQSLVKWNDTGTSNVTYYLSGLNADTVYKIYDNGVLVGSNTTDSNGLLPSFTINLASEHEIEVEECIQNLNMTSNVTSCYNSTHLINEVNYTDLNSCIENYSVYTYPVLVYNLTDSYYACKNSTTTKFVEIFNDTFGCSYSFLNETNFTVCDPYYNCSSGSCVYTGYCGDSACQTGEGETQVNCCQDCGCPVFYRCRNNVCYEKVTERALSEAGEGIANFIREIREPLTTIVMVMGVVGVVLFVFYAMGHGVGKSIEGSSGEKGGKR